MFRVDVEDFPILLLVAETSFARIYLHFNGSVQKLLGFREPDSSYEGVK